MAHKPISITNLSLEFPHKICFSGFSTQILPGERIGIIGRNGTGKSSLLKILTDNMDSTSGRVSGVDGLRVGYVPQTVLQHTDLSGGERFNKSFSDALASHPDVLVLDEPTNHLDQNTKYSLMRMLNNYQGTLIIVTHDIDLLTKCVDKIWHIENGRINVFFGNYYDYMSEKGIQLSVQQKALDSLQKEKKKLRIQRQQEAQKMAKSGKKKAKDNDKLGFDAKSGNAQAKAGAKITKLREKLEEVQTEIGSNRLPEEYRPKFVLDSAYTQSNSNLISVSFGECGYGTQTVLSEIYFSIDSNDKIALSGSNASGKTTFIRALMQDPKVTCSGDWHLLPAKDIGYLEQHYQNLDSEQTVEGTIQDRNPSMNSLEIRKHLNSFLFRKNEEVFAKVKTLSGGEKARLSLAQIAARPPKLLILDEITNNLDIETKQYIASVLSQYPGAFLVISHERAFLDQLPLTAEYMIQNGILKQKFR